VRRGGGQARPSPRILAAVGAGGTLGALARWGIAAHWPVEPARMPWSTLVINVSGAMVLGVVMTLVIERWPPTRYVRPFVCTGVCGGYTTWSTFMTETALLVRDHHGATAAAYVAVSLAAGLTATYAGIWLARLWPATSTRRTT